MQADIKSVRDEVGLKDALRKLMRAYAKWNLDMAEGLDTPNKHSAGLIEDQYLEQILGLCNGRR